MKLLSQKLSFVIALALIALTLLAWTRTGYVDERDWQRDLRGLERRLDRIEAQLGRSNRPFVRPNNAVEQRLERFERDLFDVNKRLDSIEKSIADTVARVDAVEKGLESLLKADQEEENRKED